MLSFDANYSFNNFGEKNFIITQSIKKTGLLDSTLKYEAIITPCAKWMSGKLLNIAIYLTIQEPNLHMYCIIMQNCIKAANAVMVCICGNFNFNNLIIISHHFLYREILSPSKILSHLPFSALSLCHLHSSQYTSYNL